MVKLFQPKPAEDDFGTEPRISLGRGIHLIPFDFHDGHKLRSFCPNLLTPDGHEILGVVIEWGRHTNEQLVKQFAQWLKENDPPGVKRPDKRGQKRISDRVKLERLGVMRLLHHFALKDLRTHAAEAWNHYNAPKRRWRRDVAAAHGHFRELLPFLPVNENPFAWPPKDGIDAP